MNYRMATALLALLCWTSGCGAEATTNTAGSADAVAGDDAVDVGGTGDGLSAADGAAVPEDAGTIGQGQSVMLGLTNTGSASFVTTITEAKGVEAELSADQASVVVHAPYTTTGDAVVRVHLKAKSGGEESDRAFALNVVPYGWKDPTTWTKDGPEAREHGALILDEVGGRLILIGGSGYQPYLTPLGDMWAMDLETRVWTQLQPTGDVLKPAGSRRLARIPGKPQAYLYGGYGAQGAGIKELIRVDFSTPQPSIKLLTQGSGPSARSLHAFAYDAPNERFFLFGGVDSAPRNDTWVLTVDGDKGTWVKLKLGTQAGDQPSPRYGFFYGVDETNHRLVVFSGAQGTQTIDPAQDTWVLDMAADPPVWTQVAKGEADGVPPGRRNGCSVWDPSGPRLLVFGGTADAKTSEPGLFAFDARPGHAHWDELTLPGEPDLRSSGIGIYDPIHDRALLGFGNTTSAVYSDWNVLGY